MHGRELRLGGCARLVQFQPGLVVHRGMGSPSALAVPGGLTAHRSPETSLASHSPLPVPSIVPTATAQPAPRRPAPASPARALDTTCASVVEVVPNDLVRGDSGLQHPADGGPAAGDGNESAMIHGREWLALNVERRTTIRWDIVSHHLVQWHGRLPVVAAAIVVVGIVSTAHQQQRITNSGALRHRGTIRRRTGMRSFDLPGNVAQVARLIGIDLSDEDLVRNRESAAGLRAVKDHDLAVDDRAGVPKQALTWPRNRRRRLPLIGLRIVDLERRARYC